MNYYQDGLAHSLVPRGCVMCPDVTPSCPDCADDEICSMTLQTCDICAKRECIPNPNSAASGAGSKSGGGGGGGGGGSGPNIGAIVGGILGGIAAIALVTFLVWRFWIKGRRRDYEDEELYEDEPQTYPGEEKYGSNSNNRSTLYNNRASTVTTGSTMSRSTTTTRASNVIPIAFIPGITERHGDTVPPVPPIPAITGSSTPSMNSSAQSPYSDNTQDHYFMPHDLRDSTWSGYSDGSSIRESAAFNRTSITPSLARESVTSTVYNSDLTFRPMPAQRAYSGRANVVSVSSKSSPTTPTHSVGIPDMPPIDFSKYDGRPAQPSRAPRSNIDSVAEEPEPAEGQNRHSTASASTVASSIRPGVSAAIREATRRASRAPLHGGLGATNNKPKSPSPFSDDKAIPEDE